MAELALFSARLQQQSGLAFEDVMYAAANDRLEIIRTVLPEDGGGETYRQWHAAVQPRVAVSTPLPLPLSLPIALSTPTHPPARTEHTKQTQQQIVSVLEQLIAVDTELQTSLEGLRAPRSVVCVGDGVRGGGEGADGDDAVFSRPSVKVRERERTTHCSIDAARSLLTEARAWIAPTDTRTASTSLPSIRASLTPLESPRRHEGKRQTLHLG